MLLQQLLPSTTRDNSNLLITTAGCSLAAKTIYQWYLWFPILVFGKSRSRVIFISFCSICIDFATDDNTSSALRQFGASANFFPNILLSPGFTRVVLLQTVLLPVLKGPFQVESKNLQYERLTLCPNHRDLQTSRWYFK